LPPCDKGETFVWDLNTKKKRLDRMSISDKTRKSLDKIGLTSYEIRTFTSLLKGGELTASDLSQKSGVPYSKIYEVLGTLEEKGWVSSDDSRPTKYFAKSPSTALETTKQKQELEFKNNQNIILNELIPLYEKEAPVNAQTYGYYLAC